MKRPNPEYNAGGRASRTSLRRYLKRLATNPGVSAGTIDTILGWLSKSSKRNSDKGGFGKH